MSSIKNTTTIICDEKNILHIPKTKKSTILHGGVELIIDEDKYILDNLDNDDKCAPGKAYKDQSCFSLNNVCSLVRAYNKSIEKKGLTNKLIKFKYNSTDKFSKREYRKYLLRELDKALEDVCNDQLCWLKQDFIKEMNNEEKYELLHKTYRPSGPQGRFTWLNTINLNNVMDQYEIMYPNFKYLGTVPMDFDDLDEKHKLSSIDYQQLINKDKYRFGTIFNLDYHNQAGSHWVALYSDVRNGNIIFFDSYGEEPTQRIHKLMNTLGNVCKKNQVNPNIDWNKVRHQYKNSECGVYSINFIARSLAGQTLEGISKERIDDDAVNMCRKVYFRDTAW
jgi:hypothetical protein